MKLKGREDNVKLYQESRGGGGEREVLQMETQWKRKTNEALFTRVSNIMLWKLPAETECFERQSRTRTQLEEGIMAWLHERGLWRELFTSAAVALVADESDAVQAEATAAATDKGLV